eukprot:6207641-Pleurochrysis_carterae.AAC.2
MTTRTKLEILFPTVNARRGKCGVACHGEYAFMLTKDPLLAVHVLRPDRVVCQPVSEQALNG